GQAESGAVSDVATVRYARGGASTNLQILHQRRSLIHLTPSPDATAARSCTASARRQGSSGTRDSTSPPSSARTPTCCKTGAARVAGSTAARCTWERG